MATQEEPGAPSGTTADLVKEALDEARELAKLEVALARDEVLGELNALRTSAIVFGVSAVLAILGIGMLLVALALAMGGALPALILGLVVIAVAAIAAWIGVAKLPKRPLAATKQRIEDDVKQLKEHVA